MIAAKGVSYEEELQTVTSFYKDDFHEVTLNYLLQILARLNKATSPLFVEVMKNVKSMFPGMQKWHVNSDEANQANTHYGSN